MPLKKWRKKQKAASKPSKEFVPSNLDEKYLGKSNLNFIQIQELIYSRFVFSHTDEGGSFVFSYRLDTTILLHISLPCELKTLIHITNEFMFVRGMEAVQKSIRSKLGL